MSRPTSFRTRNRVFGTGLFIVAFGFAVFPLYLKHRNGDNNLTRKNTPLSGGSIMRGAYMNYGSKDAGPDPDYDLTTGKYKGKSGEFHPTPEQVAEHRAILEKVLKAKGLAVKKLDQTTE